MTRRWAVALLVLLAAREALAQELKERAVLEGHHHPVICLAFSPDSKAVVSADGWGAIRVRHLATGKAWVHDKAHSSGLHFVAFSRDGRFLISGGRSGQVGTVKLWDAATGRERAAYEIGFNPLAVSPDGKTVASANVTGTIKLWDLPAAD